MPWSKVAILGMVIQPLIGNPFINPYYWVDDHPLLYGNNGSLDPSTHGSPQKHHGSASLIGGSLSLPGVDLDVSWIAFDLAHG